MSEGANTVAFVKYAINNGYRLIDTARSSRKRTETGATVRDSGVAREEILS